MTRPTYCRGTGLPTDECDCLRCPSPLQVKLSPCTFCEGPPVPTVQNDEQPIGAVLRQDYYGDDGLAINAHVFCHECGAQGPSHTDVIYSAEEYDEALQKAVELWQQRDARHRQLYDGGEAEGLNLFPRSDTPCATSS